MVTVGSKIMQRRFSQRLHCPLLDKATTHLHKIDSSSSIVRHLQTKRSDLCQENKTSQLFQLQYKHWCMNICTSACMWLCYCTVWWACCVTEVCVFLFMQLRFAKRCLKKTQENQFKATKPIKAEHMHVIYKTCYTIICDRMRDVSHSAGLFSPQLSWPHVLM